MEIDPKWSHAISMNICPFCGQNILEEKLRELFSSLRVVMDSLQAYLPQLNDWLLSNFNYIKVDSPDLPKFLTEEMIFSIRKSAPNSNVDNKKFTIKVQTEAGEQEVMAEKIQSESKTNDFFKRAEAVKPNIEGFQSVEEKTSHLKKMAEKIRKGGIGTVGAGMSVDDADPEAVAEYQSIISGENLISSIDNEMDDEDIPPIVQNFVKNNSNASDMQKLHEMQQRVANSRKNFQSSGGSFSRR
jgi:hypothetical protein